MREIRTSIEIEAPTSAVWKMLSDFRAYPEWNPFVRSISGTLAVGEQLDVRLGASGRKPMRVTPTVTAVRPGEEFAWLGHLGTKGIFAGHHHFSLTPTTAGTRVDHFEIFTGLLSPIVLAAIRTSTARGFEEMNLALKDRAENTRG